MRTATRRVDPPPSGPVPRPGRTPSIEPQLAVEELVRRVREGDAWSFDVLFRRHAPEVLGVTARLLGSLAGAEDVVQDVFVVALEQIHALEQPASFGGWVMRIAVRLVHRRHRRRRLLRRLGLAHGEELALGSLAAADAGPEVRAQLSAIGAALDRTSTAARIAWTLRFVEGQPLEETARLCGCSLATVKRRIAAAHEIVREHVGWQEEENDV